MRFDGCCFTPNGCGPISSASTRLCPVSATSRQIGDGWVVANRTASQSLAAPAGRLAPAGPQCATTLLRSSEAPSRPLRRARFHRHALSAGRWSRTCRWHRLDLAPGHRRQPAKGARAAGDPDETNGAQSATGTGPLYVDRSAAIRTDHGAGWRKSPRERGERDPARSLSNTRISGPGSFIGSPNTR
mgnify:FL=1